MAFETDKNRIRKIAADVDISFYQPKPVLAKYGWTQTRIAETLGASSASIAAIINGKPSIAQVKLLADTIGCSFFEFFNGSLTVDNQPTALTETSCPHCGKSVYVKTSTYILPAK